MCWTGRAGSAWTASICAEARGPCSLPDALGVAGKPGPGSYWLYVEPSVKPAVDCGPGGLTADQLTELGPLSLWDALTTRVTSALDLTRLGQAARIVACTATLQPSGPQQPP
jgi:hypothetical protein